MAAKKCEVCGRSLTAWNRSLGTRKCADCDRGESPQSKEKEYALSFEEHALTAENISERPISATVGKLIGGALIVDTTTYLAALVPGRSVLPSLIGCFIGLAIASATLFRRADILDKKRWVRFWHGDLLGYWLAYLPITFAMISNSFQSSYRIQSNIAFLDLLAYVAASVVGLLVGFVNVSRTDDKEKKEILDQFRKWQANHAVPEVKNHNMPEEKRFYFDIEEEVGKYFDDSSIAGTGSPKFVLLCGGVCSGKTTIRKQQYSNGYVLIDAGEIFLSLSRGEYYDFGAAFEEPLELIGSSVACRAVSERRNIVTEMICESRENLQAVFNAMTSIGYKVQIVYVQGDMEEGWKRNLERGNDNISAVHTEPYHQRWILKAAAAQPSIHLMNKPTEITDLVLGMETFIGEMRSANRDKIMTMIDEWATFARESIEDPARDVVANKRLIATITDSLYRTAMSLGIIDVYTNGYFGLVVSEIYGALSRRGIRIFYVLDNSLRDDRLKIITEQFPPAGFSVITPHVVDGLESAARFTQTANLPFEEVERRINEAVGDGKNIFYLERDSSVDYLERVVELAKRTDDTYVKIFRDAGPEHSDLTEIGEATFYVAN